MLEWDVMSEEEWQAMPSKPPKPPDEWDHLLDELEAGRVIRLRVTDERDLRGKRLALGRRAARRGFRVELRYAGDILAARRSPEPYVPKAARGGRG
ncbi:MAG TPA: hypothetical protein VIN09_04935 [Chloroflexota bacterium]